MSVLLARSSRMLMSTSVRVQRLACTAGALVGRNTSTSSSATQAPADYRIALPSYDRANTLQRNTLAALDAAGIDCSTRVDVFVANEQEAEKYARALSAGTYASIQIGTLGIGKQRDLILDQTGAGGRLVMCDDDIQRFSQMYAKEPPDLHKVIVKGFELCEQQDCYLWGLNNSSNTFFMPTYTTGWCYFAGPFMGFRVRDGVRLHPEFHDLLEDAQYSLLHCELDNKSLRFNGVGLKTKPYRKHPGGLHTHMSAQQRTDKEEINHKYLMGRYSRFIRSWARGKDPHPWMARSPQHLVVPLPADDLYC